MLVLSYYKTSKQDIVESFFAQSMVKLGFVMCSVNLIKLLHNMKEDGEIRTRFKTNLTFNRVFLSNIVSATCMPDKL